MCKVLVTGGAGFIGTNLCLELISMGHKVIVLDNLSSGRRVNVDLLESKGAIFVEGDILTVREFPEAELIFHLACPASPPFYQNDPVRTWKIAVLGTMRVAEWALEIGARMLFTSTSEIYGEPTEHPQVESYWGNVNPIGIRSCYDEGKRAAESLLMSMYHSAGLNVCITRLFNTYGPHMDPKDGRVISNFINQALQGQPLTMYGTGEQTRSFCYVDDTVAGIIALMASGEVGPFNIGNPQERTILNTAQVIKTVAKSNSEIVYLAPAEDDPSRRRPNITLAREKLGWEPKVCFEEGLRRTVDYFSREAR